MAISLWVVDVTRFQKGSRKSLLFRDTKGSETQKENTNWQIKERDCDLESSHFEEGCLHVVAHELVFVFFTSDSVCELGESVKISLISFDFQNFWDFHKLLNSFKKANKSFNQDREENLLKYLSKSTFLKSRKQVFRSRRERIA